MNEINIVKTLFTFLYLRRISEDVPFMQPLSSNANFTFASYSYDIIFIFKTKKILIKPRSGKAN